MNGRHRTTLGVRGTAEFKSRSLLRGRCGSESARLDLEPSVPVSGVVVRGVDVFGVVVDSGHGDSGTSEG